METDRIDRTGRPESRPEPSVRVPYTEESRPLMVGSTSDAAEREADVVADSVILRLSQAPPDSSCRVQRAASATAEVPTGSGTADESPAAARIQRSAVRRDERDADPVRRPRIARAAMRQFDDGVGSDGGAVDSDTHTRIRRATTSGGRPLETQVQRRMEQGFGADFSRVRIHTDAEADQISAQLNARAFTLGNDVFFGNGDYAPGSEGGDHLLAHELTHVLQQQGAVARSVGIRRSAVVVRRRAYDDLAPTQRAQVDALAERTYYDQSKLFEVALGRVIAKSSKANSAAKDLSKRVRKLVDAWVKKVQRDSSQAGRDAKYREVFGALDATSTGAIPAFAEDIKAVLDKGTLRERLTLVYSAIRTDNLQMMLNVAYKDANSATANTSVNFQQPDTTITTANIPRGFANTAGLQKHLSRNDAVKNEIATRTNATAPVNTRSAMFGRKQLVTDMEQTGEKQFAGTDERTAQNAQQRQTLETSELTEREIRSQVNHLRSKESPAQPALSKSDAVREARAAGQKPMSWLTAEYKRLQLADQPGTAQPGATPTQWVSGEQWYRAQADSALAVHASKIKATLRAATSGTTDMFLHASQYLGMDSTNDLRKVRLAMLAWMLPARDHSFYEIMTSATQYGLTDFDPNADLWTAYEQPILPLGIKTNKAAIPTKPSPAVPDGRYPGWYLSPPGYPGDARGPRYKDIVAGQIIGQPQLVRGPTEIGVFTNAGVPVGAVEHVDDAGLLLLKNLAAAVARLKLDSPMGATNDAAYQLFIASPAVQQVIAALPNDGLMIACALVHKLHPTYALPAPDQAQVTRAKILTPHAANARIDPVSAAALDTQTSPGLQRPGQGGGSGKAMADIAYRANKQKFIEDVLEFQQDKYDADPAQMNAWFEVFQRKHGDAFPAGDLNALRALNNARQLAQGTPTATAVEQAFDDAYQRVFGLEALTDAEKTAINLYTVSSVANSLNAAAKGTGPVDGTIAETAEVLLSALEKLPAYTGGPVYRGDANRGFRVGDVTTYNEFVSTSKTVKSSFVNQQNKNWCTHALVVESHRSGKDIMALSDYSKKELREMEGEILFPPGTRFVIKRIEDWTNLKDPLQDTKDELKQVMLQIRTETDAGNDVTALTAQKVALQKRQRDMPARSQLLNKIWVYMDEV